MSAPAAPSSEPFVIVARRYDDPDVQALVAQVQAEYVSRYGGPDAAEVAAGDFDPPHGQFLVGLLCGRPVAMGGWRRLTSDSAEIKRMFVVHEARRRGLARRVLSELERRAAAAGYARLVLNTGPEQPEAVALYVAAGYRSVAGFGHYACHPRALFYGKAVAGAAQPRVSRG